jgi:predicted dehydrogenase
MAKNLGWGIIGLGNIAKQFASGLRVSDTGRLVAVGSRDPNKAKSFAAEFGALTYGDYSSVLLNPQVDVVYVATPHHTHMDDTIACARAGKGVLCEKPFTLNALEASRAIMVVKEAGVFFMEAFMYRCSPQTAQLISWLKEIGEVSVMHAEFAWQGSEDWENFRNDSALGGGGLMDVGCYPVSLARLVFGGVPLRARYSSLKNSRGVDWIGSGHLEFSDNKGATFLTGIGISCKNNAVIYGSSGHIEVSDPWKQRPGSTIRLVKDGEVVEQSLGISNDQLYAYEADSVARYFGKKQCSHFNWQESLDQAVTLDMLRADAGLKFDAEMKA